MKKPFMFIKARRATARLSGMSVVASLVVILTIPAAFAQNAIDPDAKKILAAMSNYLGGLQTFAADFDADFDVITAEGQKLKFASSGDLIIQRPAQLRVTRKGTIADVELILDGESLSIYGRGLNGYIQLPASTIDDAIRVVRQEIGFDAPGADFLAGSPFDSEVTDIVSGTHVGMTSIEGNSVHHLAFRGDQVDWQLWVKDGDEPLPLQYVVTSKWMTGAPEYSLRFRNWDVAPSISSSVFTFTPSADAKKLSSITVDETGQLVGSGE